MRKEDISKLMQRYLSGHQAGREPYFDADEIDLLLDSFEESDNYAHYDGVLALGLKLHPSSVELKIRECKFCMFNEEYDKAMQLIDQITDKGNQDLDMIRLECYCYLDHCRKAITYLEQLIRGNCEYTEALFEHLVPVMSDLDKTSEAKELIARGLRLFPDNLILKDELCFIYEAEGNYSEAVRLCQGLIDKDPYSYETWFTLGRLYTMTSEFDKAIEAFDFALTCDDNDIELKILRSYCLFMNENYKEAIDAYEEIALDDESRERIKPLIAECHIKMEQYEECYHLLKSQVYDMQKDDELESSVYINFIRCCMETGRDKEAVDMLYRTVELFPDDVRVLSLLALTYIENGKEELALSVTNKIFHKIEEEEPQTEPNKDVFRNSHYLYFKGNLNKALKFYKKVIRFSPELPFMNIHMAMAYFSLGDMELFGKHYRKTSRQEMKEYLRLTGLYDIRNNLLPRHIPPEELTKQFLENKDNNN